MPITRCVSFPVALGASLSLILLWQALAQETKPAGYVSSARCRSCHAPQAAAYAKSRHGRVRAKSSSDPLSNFKRSTGYDPATGKFAEDGIGCEACHGPGGNHAGKAGIVSFGALKADRAAMVCGQCHSRGKAKDGRAFPAGYRAGADLNLFWVAERGAAVDEEYNQWLDSKHARKGVWCGDCHVVHSADPRKPLTPSDPTRFCGSCHEGARNLKEHAPHAGPKDTCLTCHMPDGSHRF
ncbi:MAG: hypothetical protein KA419_11770 [Acidobacteria bacterium]|nr:hypothetical protein [Acidobacteriota bacterium]